MKAPLQQRLDDKNRRRTEEHERERLRLEARENASRAGEKEK